MPVPAPVPSAPISGSNGPWLSELEIDAHRAEARRKRVPPPWSGYLDERIRYYGGPHVWDALQKVKTAAAMLSPGADIVDARQNYDSAIQNARSGKVRPAVRDFGYGLLSNMGLSEVSQPSQAIFTGAMAATAKHAKLREAEKLAKSGADDITIWNKTGWSQGVDGKWRSEIDDSQMRFKPEAWSEISAPVSRQWRGRAADLIDHPEFFRAYPELADLDTLIRRRGSEDDRFQGYFGRRPPFMQELQLRMEKYGSGHQRLDPEKLKDWLLHELQHAAQWRERFSPGGSLGSRGAVKDYLVEDTKRQHSLAAQLEKALSGTPLATREAAYLRQMLQGANEAISANQQKLKRLDTLADDKLYWQLAGEVEARNVQTRRELTPADKRSAPPSFTEDVPRARQILLHPPSRHWPEG
jgi:hypothetical protein